VAERIANRGWPPVRPADAHASRARGGASASFFCSPAVAAAAVRIWRIRSSVIAMIRSNGRNGSVHCARELRTGCLREVASMTLHVELLGFDDCPNRGVALERLRSALDAEQVTAVVTAVDVADPALAHELRFLGSPSVRINGVDIEPSARSAVEFGLMCRTYKTAAGVEGAPSIEMLRIAIRAQMLRFRSARNYGSLIVRDCGQELATVIVNEMQLN
jgi:hypothetical protein